MLPLDIVIIILRRCQNFRQLKHWSNFWDSAINKIAFLPGNIFPQYQLSPCHKHVGTTDCGVFAIAYSIDILFGKNPSEIVYDQSKLRQHLVDCFQKEHWQCSKNTNAMLNTKMQIQADQLHLKTNTIV